MTLKENAIVLGLLIAAAAGAAWYLKGQVAGFVPDVVADGFEASSVLGYEAVDAILHPLNAFGIAPGNFPDGKPKYAITLPWLSDDPVSNNDSGMNFNYF